ncbi:MAG TPA: serine/threonine-protein kinase [Thermoanaerobaculia bacterium]
MPVSPLHTPAKLGRYEILDEIGKGAMGVVYLAKDPLIGRLVALKTFRIGYSVKDSEMEQFRARFRREAQSAGILSHPNIVTIHDVVEESDEGVAFIAMEYVRGTNLKVLLQRDTPLELAFVAGLIDQVADALDYAHSRGVVHRDVKPANIIITADDRVKITDFGIARLDTSNLTQEGQLLGTPNYMSPEQILGKDVDHRADLFSLGVVLYEMLTRHKPFQGENLTVVSHRIVYDRFTPPAEYVRDLPPGVEHILVRALDKDPARRYQQAHDMAADLRRLATVRAAGEAMNETQSLPLGLVQPPAPAMPAAAPAPSGDDTTPIPALQPLPAAPPAPRSPLLAMPPWPRLAAVAWVTAAATVLVATAAWLAVDWRQAGLRDVAVVAGPPPVLPGARRKPPQEAALAADRRQQIEVLLEQARRSVAGQSYALADAAAHGVLALDATNAGAQAILATLPNLQDAPARPSPPRPPRVAHREPPPLPEPAPSSPPVRPPPPPVAVPTDAKLQVHLFSEQSSGILMVYLGDKQLMRDEFDFSEKKNLFWRIPGQGFVDQAFTIPAGTVHLRVYVTPTGQRARVQEISGNFPGAIQRRLNVKLDKDGNLTAELE